MPPPGGSRMSTCAASRPIVGSPSPSPGLSARGCIPRPLSATTTVSSSAAVEMVTRTRPGSRSMKAWMTELVTASVTAKREIHHVVGRRAVLLRELAHPAPSQRDARRLSRQLPVLAGRDRRHRREIL